MHYINLIRLLAAGALTLCASYGGGTQNAQHSTSPRDTVIQIVACEGGQPVTINCTDSVINIVAANYRTNASSSSQRSRHITHNDIIYCSDKASRESTVIQCNGRLHCSGETPCKGTNKYLNVSYTCVSANYTRSPTPANDPTTTLSTSPVTVTTDVHQISTPETSAAQTPDFSSLSSSPVPVTKDILQNSNQEASTAQIAGINYLHPVYPIQAYPTPTNGEGPYSNLVLSGQEPTPWCFNHTTEERTVRIGFSRPMLVTGITSWGVNDTWPTNFTLWYYHNSINSREWRQQRVPYYEMPEEPKVFTAETSEQVYHQLKRPFMALSVGLSFNTSMIDRLCLAVQIYGCYEERFKCPDQYPVQHGLSCYQKQPDADDWSTAVSVCKGQGGKLPVIQDQLQNSLLFETLMDTKVFFHIGLNDLVNKTKYGWLNSTQNPDFTNYEDTSVPNEYSESCGHIDNKSLKWNFGACKQDRSFICKGPKISNPSGYCLEGWQKWGQSCYRVWSEELIWTEARQFCKNQSDGYDLVTIMDWREQDFVSSLIESRLWLGISRENSAEYYRHDPITTKIRWFAESKVSKLSPYTRELDYVYISGSHGYNFFHNWMDGEEKDKRPYACMKKLDGICPPEYDLNTNMCIHINSIPRTREGARLDCRADGARLADIKNNDMQQYLALFNDDNKNHKWADGDSMNFKRWALGEPRIDEGQCVFVDSSSKWRAENCSARHAVVCVKSKPSECHQLYHNDTYNGYLYTLHERPLALEDAENDCNDTWGGHLASVLDEEENQWMFNFTTSVRKHRRFLIGLYRTDVNRGSTWKDGSSPSYLKLEGNSGTSDGKATAVTIEGAWVYVDSKTPYPYLCKTNLTEAHSKGQQFSRSNIKNITQCECQSGWVSADEHCIKRMDQPTTYNEADSICKSVDATLLQDKDADMHEYVIEHIILPSLWTGLTDVKNEGHFEWSDGTVSNFTSWADGAPVQPSLEANCASLQHNKDWREEKCSMVADFFCHFPFSAEPLESRLYISTGESISAGQEYSADDGRWRMHFSNTTGQLYITDFKDSTELELPARGDVVEMSPAGDLIMYNNSQEAWRLEGLGVNAKLHFTYDGGIIVQNGDGVIWSADYKHYEGYTQHFSSDACNSIIDQEEYIPSDIFSSRYPVPHADPSLAYHSTPWVEGEAEGGWQAGQGDSKMPDYFQITLPKRHWIAQIMLMPLVYEKEDIKFTAQLQISADGEDWTNYTCGSMGMWCERSAKESVYINFRPRLLTSYLRFLLLVSSAALRVDVLTCSADGALHSDLTDEASYALVDGSLTTCINVDKTITVSFYEQWIEQIRVTSDETAEQGWINVTLHVNDSTAVLALKDATSSSFLLESPEWSTSLTISTSSPFSLCEVEVYAPYDKSVLSEPSWQSQRLNITLPMESSVTFAHHLNHDILYSRLLVKPLSGINMGFTFDSPVFGGSSEAPFTYFYNSTHITVETNFAIYYKSFYCVDQRNNSYVDCEGRIFSVLVQLWTVCDFPPPALMTSWYQQNKTAEGIDVTETHGHGLRQVPLLALGLVQNKQNGGDIRVIPIDYDDRKVYFHHTRREASEMFGMASDDNIWFRLIMWTNLGGAPVHDQTFTLNGQIGPKVTLTPALWTSETGLVFLQMRKHKAGKDVFDGGSSDVVFAHAHNSMRLWWNESFVEQFQSVRLSWYIHGKRNSFTSCPKTSCFLKDYTTLRRCHTSGHEADSICTDVSCPESTEWTTRFGYEYRFFVEPTGTERESRDFCSTNHAAMLASILDGKILEFLQDEAEKKISPTHEDFSLYLDLHDSRHHVNISHIDNFTRAESSMASLCLTKTSITQCKENAHSVTACRRPICNQFNKLSWTKIDKMRPWFPKASKALTAAHCMSQCKKNLSDIFCDGIAYEPISADCHFYSRLAYPEPLTEISLGNAELYLRTCKQIAEPVWELAAVFTSNRSISVTSEYNNSRPVYVWPYQVIKDGIASYSTPRVSSLLHVHKIRLSCLNGSEELGFMMFVWPGVSSDDLLTSLSQQHPLTSSYTLHNTHNREEINETKPFLNWCLSSAELAKPMESQFLAIHFNAACMTEVNSATPASTLQQVSAIVQDSSHLVFEVDTRKDSKLLLYEDIDYEGYKAYTLTFTKQDRQNCGVVFSHVRETYSREYQAYEFIKWGKQYLWVDWSFGHIQIGHGQYVDTSTRVLEVYIHDEPVRVNHVKITGKKPWRLPAERYCLPLYLPNTKEMYVYVNTSCTVPVNCVTGYWHVSDDSKDSFTAECQYDGTWSIATDCQRKPCNLSVANSNSTNVTALFGDYVVVSCNLGYNIQDQEVNVTEFSTQCLDNNVWSNEDNCTAIRCKETTIDNSNVTGVAIRALESLSVACNDGYIISDSDNSTTHTLNCSQYGMWTDVIKCSPVDCGFPLNTSITFFENTTLDTRFPNSVKYTCVEGYYIDGNPEASCQQNGTWTTFPECRRQPCNLSVANSNTTNITAFFDDEVLVNCNIGYHVQNETYNVNQYITKCLANSVWSLLANCTAIQCEPLTAAYSNGTGVAVRALESITIACYDGFIISDSNNITTRTMSCSQYGIWSDEVNCTRQECHLSVTNSNCTNITALFEDELVVSCDLGYHVQGQLYNVTQYITKCLADSIWSREDNCNVIQCDEKIIVHSNASGVSARALESVIVACLDGFFISDSNNSTIGALTCSLNGTWSEWTSCIPVDCGFPLNTSVTFLENSMPDSRYPNNATYICAEGHFIEGNPEISCQKNGTWTTMPVCKKQPCYLSVANSNSTNITAFFEDELLVSCDLGYSVLGQLYNVTQYSTKCLAESVWSKEENCTAIRCGPITVEHSNVSDVSVRALESLTVACHGGYSISDNIGETHTINCTLSGTWSDTTKCKRITCDNPPLNEFIKVVNGSESPYYIGSIVVLVCKLDYMSHQLMPHQVECLSTGNWTSTPQCYGPCPQLDVPVTVSLSTNMTLYGTDVHVECLNDTVLFGSPILTCTEFGNWSAPIPQCNERRIYGIWTSFTPWSNCNATCGSGSRTRLRNCQRIDPPALPCEGHAFEVEDCENVACTNHWSWSSWSDWSLCSKTCEYGQKHRTRPCIEPTGYGPSCPQKNQTMTISCAESDCPEMSCDPLHVPAHAVPVTLSQRKLAVITFTCLKGYEFPGGASSVVTKCSDQYEWVPPTVPDCIRVSCPLPSLPRNTWREVNGNNTSWNAVMVYRCYPGFLFPDGTNIASTICLSNKMWSNHIDACHPKECDLPDDGSSLWSKKSVRTDELIEQKCPKGQRFTDGLTSRTSVCTASGNLSNYQPCHRNWCGALPYVPNALVTISSGAHPLSASITCLPGYRFHDGTRGRDIECIAEEWVLTEHLSCHAKTCPPVPEPTNARASTQSALFGTVVRFTCLSGYWIRENVFSFSIICTEERMWNGTVLNCTEVTCKAPPIVDHATQTGYNMSVGSTVMVTCLPWHVLQNGKTAGKMRCSERGRWTPNLTCSEKLCPPVPIIHHSHADTSSRVVNTTVIYTCEQGFSFPNRRKIVNTTCLETGEWSKVPTNCRLVTCSLLAKWDNYVVNTTSNSYGTFVKVSCSSEHRFSNGHKGWLNTLCEVNGLWSPGVPDCKPVVNIYQQKIEVTESENSKPIGSIALIFLGLLGGCILLIDLCTSLKDSLLLFRRNVGHLLPQAWQPQEVTPC